MAGVILLSAMLVCGIWLYIKRRRERLQDVTKRDEETHAMIYDDDHTHDKKTEITYKADKQDESDKNI